MHFLVKLHGNFQYREHKIGLAGKKIEILYEKWHKTDTDYDGYEIILELVLIRCL